MRRKYIFLYISIFLLIISLSITFIAAYLTDEKENSANLTIGEVGVLAVEVYYLSGTNKVSYNEVQVLTQTKRGVYEVNIVDPSALNYITNLRVDIKVKSNVDSYLRVKINDQIVRKTTNYQGVITETVIRHAPTYFNVDSTWHKQEDPLDVRNTYYYYPQKIKKTQSEEYLLLSFVIPYPESEEYNAYGEGYSLQLGISYDIVQANYGGPLNNWGLQTPPWGGSW